MSNVHYLTSSTSAPFRWVDPAVKLPDDLVRLTYKVETALRSVAARHSWFASNPAVLGGEQNKSVIFQTTAGILTLRAEGYDEISAFVGWSEDPDVHPVAGIPVTLKWSRLAREGGVRMGKVYGLIDDIVFERKVRPELKSWIGSSSYNPSNRRREIRYE